MYLCILMIKALFFDIDGTLVSFSKLQIPQSTIEAIEQARKNGVKIFISTGRPPQIMNNIGALQERGLIDGYITMNGSYCYVGDEIIYKHPIAKDNVQTLVTACKENNYPCIFVGEKEISVCQPNDMLRKIFYDFLRVDEFEVVSFEQGTSYDSYQLTPFFSIEVENELKKTMRDSEFGRWHPAFVDITAKGNTKQKGMEHILEHFNLDVSETMSFGDGGNDIPMIRFAGVGVAMGNANEEVKKEADYVTTSVDEDGIANALKHYGVI